MKYEDIKKYLVPGTIVFFDGNSFISNAIQECQNIYTYERFNKHSQWSHVGFVGDDGQFHESTFGRDDKVFLDGLTHTKLEQRFSEKMLKENKKLGFQTLEGVEQYTRRITQWFIDNTKIKYGKIEILGDLWVLLKWKFYHVTGQHKKAATLLQKKNPINSSRQVVCIAGVADAITAVWTKYIGIESSIATVDEGYYACLIPNKRIAVEIK